VVERLRVAWASSVGKRKRVVRGDEVESWEETEDALMTASEEDLKLEDLEVK